MGGGFVAGANIICRLNGYTSAALKKAGQLCVLIALGGGLYFVSLVALGFRPHHFRRVEK